MSEPTPPKSGKTAAAAAAKTLLADRIALVNTLGDAVMPSTSTANKTRQQPKPAKPSTKQPKPRAPPTPPR